MTKMIYNIINKNYSDAEKLVRENLEYIAERKIIEMKKMIAAKNIIKEEARPVTGGSKDEIPDEAQNNQKLKKGDRLDTPDSNKRVSDAFDDMENPNTKEDQLKEKAPPGAKYERMVKHIKAEYAKNGLTDKEKAIAYATAWKAKNSTMEEEDSAGDESSMARSELMALTKDAKNIMSKIKGNKELEAWTQSKITKAADYMNSVSDYMQGNDQIEETVDYPMSYMKSHPDYVEIRHITMSGHDNPHKTPERAKQQVRTNPKHKELKDQGYKIYKYGEHAEPKDFYTRPVKITKGSSASVKDQNIAEADTTPPSGGRRFKGADLDRLARRIVYGIKMREKAGAERKRLRSALREKKPADPNMQQEAEETLHEALPKVYGRNKLVARKRMKADREIQIRNFMAHDPKAGESIIAMGKKEKSENKAFASGKKEIDKLKKADMEEETLHEARFRIIKARIRNGKIQRRKRVSTAPGLTFRGGKLTRMSPAERRHRKMGQRRGKLKRRAKLSRTLRKRTMSLRKRSRLGIKS